MSQHWLSGPYVFKMVQPSLSRAHQTPSSTSTNWMHTLLCKLNYLLTKRSSVHWDHNTSPLREVQFFTSTWSPNQLSLPILKNSNIPNSFIRVASQNGCTYVAAYVPCPRDQANRSSLNELRRAQATVTRSSATNQTSWVIWTSSLPSWRTTAFNLSL